MLQKLGYYAKMLDLPLRCRMLARKAQGKAWDDFVYFLVSEQARNGFC